MNVLGSFWASTYQGLSQVRELADSKLQLEAQTHLDLLELISSLSRIDCPIFHRDNWHLITLKESELNPASYSLAKYDQADIVFDQPGLQYDVPRRLPAFAWQVPEGLADAPLLFNRITNPSLTYVKGVDYSVMSGYLVFRDNPFDSSLAPKRSMFAGNAVVDREVALWAFAGQFDYQTVYRQFGYVLQLKLTSGEAYKTLVNAMFDALVLGTTASHLQAAWSAVTGIPLVIEDTETVEVIRDEGHRQLVVTNRNVYAFAPSATVLVVEGAVVRRGQPLTDALIFFEFNRGQCPSAAAVPAIALGRGVLAAGFFGDITFENKDVPLIVTTDADGYTKVSWEVSGWPGDVELFFDSLHERGRATGTTIAHLLDRRPAANRDTEPSAGALPPAINPLAFLCRNVFRDNFFLVKVKAAAAGLGTGMHAARFLRKIVPPQTCMIVLVELEYTDAAIKMDGPGDATSPGYEEEVKAFLGHRIAETLGPGMLIERVRCYQIGGRCV